jgi:hypothetical protein
MLKSAYGEKTSVFEWHKGFREGRESLQGNELKGRFSTSRTEESTEAIQKSSAEDRTLSVRMLEEMTGIHREIVRLILGLSFRKVGPGIFCVTVHRCILWSLSSSF